MEMDVDYRAIELRIHSNKSGHRHRAHCQLSAERVHCAIYYQPTSPLCLQLWSQKVYDRSDLYMCWRLGSFFFSSRRRHTRSLCDWSSDVCFFFFKQKTAYEITV